MANKAFVGRIFLARDNGGSPTVYDRVCQVFDIGGVGKTNEQVEVTNFCSDGNKEYIGGLADGAEVTLQLNFETGATGAVIDAMQDDVDNKVVRGFELQIEGQTKGVVDKIYRFSAAALSWVLNPSVNSRNTINFGIKISGDIQRINP